jgi:hypothetical protein
VLGLEDRQQERGDSLAIPGRYQQVWISPGIMLLFAEEKP